MGDEKRKKYNPSNPRLPVFYERFHDLTDCAGGVTKVSELTGISRPTVQFWYNGQRTPDAENLCTLSRAFGVSVDYLLGLVENNNSTNDEKLRMVSEYSGLSNNAIKSISLLKIMQPYALEAINALFEFAEYWSDISRYLSLAVSSLRIQKIDGAENSGVNTESFTTAMDFLSQIGGGYMTLGDEPLNIPKGTLLLSAIDASDFYKAKAVKVFSDYLDEYIDDASNKRTGTEGE